MLAKLISWIAGPDLTPAIPDREECAFFDKECILCGSTFDVSPDWAFDRRLAHYCPDCYDEMPQ